MSDRFDLRLGDSAEVLRSLEPESVDALVTDPPAGIAFMGKTWDHDHGGRDHWIKAFAALFRECLRVLKPGAHGVVWALPRTSHWTATALEDAGLTVRDVGVHIFGSGFPKSLNLPGGLGTALKPASEHWIVVRKPLGSTVAECVLKHGTGALNIDGCRIQYASQEDKAAAAAAAQRAGQQDNRQPFGGGFNDGPGSIPGFLAKQDLGRWPANLTLSEEAAALLDEQSGEAGGAAPPSMNGSATTSNAYGTFAARSDVFHADSGGASRFFYTAKPSRSERDIGCEGLPAATGGEATGRVDGSAGTQNPRAGAGRNGGARNIHPTVKPVELMRWLCRLVTPKGGLVLDPFMGSGTTGIACSREGFRFLGIEREAQYFEIARRRLLGDSPLLNRMELKLGGAA